MGALKLDNYCLVAGMTPETSIFTVRFASGLKLFSHDPILFNGGDTNLYGYVGTVGKPGLLETNLYGYAANDPINFFDPTGLYSETYVAQFLTPGQQAYFGAGLVLAGVLASRLALTSGITPAGAGFGLFSLLLLNEGGQNLLTASKRGLQDFNNFGQAPNYPGMDQTAQCR